MIFFPLRCDCGCDAAATSMRGSVAVELVLGLLFLRAVITQLSVMLVGRGRGWLRRSGSGWHRGEKGME